MIRVTFADGHEDREDDSDCYPDAHANFVSVLHINRGADETARSKRLTFKEQKELQSLFDKIEAVEQRVEELSSALSDPATYERPRDEIAALNAKLDEAKHQVSQLTARWEELEARHGEAGA